MIDKLKKVSFNNKIPILPSNNRFFSYVAMLMCFVCFPVASEDLTWKKVDPTVSTIFKEQQPDNKLLELGSLDITNNILPLKPIETSNNSVSTIIRGYIATRAGQSSNKEPSMEERDIYLPGIYVYLRNLNTGQDTKPVLTDLSGRFTLFSEGEGKTKVCWKAKGFLDGCTRKPYSVGETPLHVSKILIEANTDRGPSVFGQVLLKGGDSLRKFAPLANINAFASIELEDDGGNTLHHTYVNNFHNYFIPSVPVDQGFTLLTIAGDEVYKNRILPDANLGGAGSHKIDITLNNSAPRINPLVARNGGKRVQVANPGDILQLKIDARDPDGDDLKFKWHVYAGSGELSDIEGEEVDWKLPSNIGFYTVEVFAYDGKGGYESSTLSLKTGEEGVVFSGVVRGTDTPVLADAEVEINGKKVYSDTNGFFRVHIEETDRYVFNIRKFGYGLMSKIYGDSMTGGDWTLVKATVQTANPQQVIVVSDDRSKRNCVGPKAFNIDWRDFPVSPQPQWQDGKGNIIPPQSKGLNVPVPGQGDLLRGCGEGVRLTIPANSLVDSNGNPPPGLVDVSVSTIDILSPQQMPGDYTVTLAGGDVGVAQSYGAGTVDIRDATQEYNLKKGAEAKFEIAVDQAQMTGAPIPPIIPLLYYEEEKGVWYQEGEAKLVGSKYVASLPHFSTINADLVKSNQACIRIISPTLPANYDLEVMIPMGGGAAPKILNLQIDNSAPSEHVVYNLPTNVNVVLTPISTGTPVPFGNFVVNTGAQQNPSIPNLPVGPPYNACSTLVELSDLALPVAPSSGEFLHGLYTFLASNLTELDAGSPADVALSNALDTATDNYYSQIDPRSKRLTLGGFKATNGFGGAGEINAKFANSGDLGFGRDMHCVENGLDVACYVTNYGNINTNDVNDVAATVADNAPVATVAMEYTQIESQPGSPVEYDDPDRVVKFYVYNGNLNSSTLLNSANLDAFGERPIPQLCMVCHGGDYPTPPVGGAPVFGSRNEVKLGSKFLPFDLSLYTFAAAPYDKASQQDEFKALNEDIVFGSPPDAAIQEVITQMYSAGPIQSETFSVANWNASVLEQDMYKKPIAESCRTCHIGHAFPSLNFDESSDVINLLGAVESRVCTQHVMPHAKVTHDLFWLSFSPSQPALMQIFGDAFGNVGNGWDGTLCGDYTASGGSTAGFYATNIQPIWNGVGTGATPCTNCHVGASPPAGLNLSSSVSYANIFNINSTTNPGDKRVAPGGGVSAANNSLILQVLRNATSPASPGTMPPSGAEVNNAAYNAVESWILSGAPL